MATPVFFPTPSAFRQWLESNHAGAGELWVGFYKRDSGKPSLTWPESVDEALCVGWIDGIRKRIDDASYMIRFTPRRSGSVWSTVNTARARALAEQGRMQPAGLEAYGARTANKSGIYSYEQRPTDLPEPYARRLRKQREAWQFFRAQPPSYRKVATWWIVSAKKEDTRLARVEKLAACSAKGLRLPEITLRREDAPARATLASAPEPEKAARPATIDAYLAALTPDKRAALERLRQTIRAAVPNAAECISYGLPSFRLDGRILVWFGASRNHCSFYPGAVVAEFAEKLEHFETSKGTVRFQPDDPLPVSLVRALLKARIARGGVRRQSPSASRISNPN